MIQDLTPTEIEILQAIAAGETHKSIANQRWITRNTVTTYTKAIREKLQAKTMAQAVAIGIREEMIQ